MGEANMRAQAIETMKLARSNRSAQRKRDEAAFEEVVAMIEEARQKSYQVLNAGLIDLYWRVGRLISRKIAAAGWGKNTVSELAAFVRRRQPNLKGFSASNLWRMRQFYETYAKETKLAPLVRELNWTKNLLILGRAKRTEEREFYIRLCLRERWGKRELERQLKGALFERTVLSPPKLAPAVREIHPGAEELLKDNYLLEFLDLPQVHSEADLQAALISNLKRFLLELGRDFTFVGEEHPQEPL